MNAADILGHRKIIEGDNTVVSLKNAGNHVAIVVYSRLLSRNLGRGFFISQDGGKTWSKTTGDEPATLAGPGFNFIAAEDDHRFIYKYDDRIHAYLRSEDGGLHWKKPASKFDATSYQNLATWVSRGWQIEFTVVGIAPHRSELVYSTVRLLPPDSEPIQAPTILYRSSDGGDSWSQVFDAFKNRGPLGFSKSNANVMFGIGAKGEVLRTNDGGSSWNVVSTLPLPVSPSDDRSRWLKYDTNVFQLVVAGAHDETIFAASRLGMLRSSDGGLSWSLLYLGFDERDSINSFALSEGDSPKLYVGTKYGLFTSNDLGCRFVKVFPAGGWRTRSESPKNE